jgi:hypothetical protein
MTVPASTSHRWWRRPLLAGIVLALTTTWGCDRDDQQRVVGGNVEGVGHVSLSFSGAVNGRMEGLAEVACFEPAEEGDRYTVSIDAEQGIAVGGTVFRALDVAIVGYRAPGDYDLGRSLASDEVDRDDFFLLFERSSDPFGWGGKESSGTLSIDPGGASGRLSLAGWQNSSEERLAVQGTFRCGKPPGR